MKNQIYHIAGTYKQSKKFLEDMCDMLSAQGIHFVMRYESMIETEKYEIVSIDEVVEIVLG